MNHALRFCATHTGTTLENVVPQNINEALAHLLFQAIDDATPVVMHRDTMRDAFSVIQASIDKA